MTTVNTVEELAGLRFGTFLISARGDRGIVSPDPETGEPQGLFVTGDPLDGDEGALFPVTVVEL